MKPGRGGRAIVMVGALLVVWILFSWMTGGTFLTARNLSLLARQMSVTGILGVGMVLVIVAGQIDLSVGALAGLSGGVAALLSVDLGLPLFIAFLAGLGTAALLGAAQGLLVAWLRIPAFVVTLGGMLAFQGALLGLTGGVSRSPGAAFLLVGKGYVPRGLGWAMAVALAAALLARSGPSSRKRLLGVALAAGAFTAILNGYQGIPVPVLLLLGLALLLFLVSEYTPFGRHLYAIGGNRDAAYYSGIDIPVHIVGVFTLMGLLSGIAGIVLTARVGSATPDAGRTMELDAIAGAVIGGASLLGGEGTVWGALLGALFMASLDNGMSLLNTEAFWQPVLKGSILVAAVAADMAWREPRG